MRLTFYAHASFRLQAPVVSVVTDPYTPAASGFYPIDEPADLVIMSSATDRFHSDPSHVRGKPTVVNALLDVPPERLTVHGVRIRAFGLPPAGGGRDLHGGRAVDARPAQGPAGRSGAAAGGRCRSAAVCRAPPGAGRHHRLRRRAGGAADGGVPQAAESQVIVNAHRINGGRMPELEAKEGSDFFFVDAADPEEGVRKLLAVVGKRIPGRFGLDPVRDVQVLCPMNRGGLGARSLNIELQQALNPPGELRVERFGWTFCPGDKVMQVANDYERNVFNGDLGVITGLDIEEAELTVSFEGRAVVYGFGELNELILAYATTIHKSQGSEYPAVVIPLTTQHYTMLARNLLYTGVTRGKRLVVLVGQRRALAVAVRNGSGRRRWSKLREWLAPGSATSGRSRA